MRRPIIGSCAGVAATILVSLATAPAAHAKVSTAGVPKPVLQTVNTRFRDPTIHAVGKELDKGATVWELGLTVDHRNVDVIVRPGGDIVLFEREVTRTELPAAVVKTLDAKYPRATYKRLEEVFKVAHKQEKLAFYEALLQTAGKQWLSVTISTQGKVTLEERKKSGEID